MSTPTRVVVTGATGYIGARLVPRLLDEGYLVRCLVRSPRKLASRDWYGHPNVEVVEGDLEDEAGLTRHLQGAHAAYYLVHAMISAGEDYAEKDRRMARHFARAAEAAAVDRIVYLGGLGETGDDLSEHLASRRQVEHELASGRVPVTVLRAAMIVGAGSASFEILRYLVEHLPVMVTPRWVATECQPIAVRNVLHYLVQCLAVPETAGRVLDIGGPDVVTYRQLMELMAEERGLPRRLIIPVPVLTPRLSSWWIHLVTPINARVARPLAEGLRNRVVARNDDAARLMPQALLGAREAIRAALAAEADMRVESSWTSAGPIPGDPDWAGGHTFVDERSRVVDAPPAVVWDAVCRLGGNEGWPGANWLWKLRGWLDRLVGGPGLRRGRRHPSELGFGETIDFWRVVDFERERRLTLRAEMRLPGVAVLDFGLAPAGGDPARTTLTQTARFRPRGLFGLLYWYGVLPAHALVFNGLLDGIVRMALRFREAAASGPALPGTKEKHGEA